jgi:hypothetical protein
VGQLGQFGQIVVVHHNLGSAYQVVWSLLEVVERCLGHPLIREFEPIVEIEVHYHSIDRMALAAPVNNVEAQVEVEVADVEDIGSMHPMWQSGVVVADQPTCVEDNTYLADRDSCCFGMALGCKSMLDLKVVYCKILGVEKQVNHC